MFGLIGNIIYGVAYTIGWAKDEKNEQHARQHAKSIGLSYYIDKRGRRRWASTGRKQTPQEILNENTKSLKKRIQDKKQFEIDKKKKDLDFIIQMAKKDYDLCIIHKDRLSFEEYLGTRLPSSFYDKHEELRIYRDIIPKEKLDKINSNHIHYG